MISQQDSVQHVVHWCSIKEATWTLVITVPQHFQSYRWIALSHWACYQWNLSTARSAFRLVRLLKDVCVLAAWDALWRCSCLNVQTCDPVQILLGLHSEDKDLLTFLQVLYIIWDLEAEPCVRGSKFQGTFIISAFLVTKRGAGALTCSCKHVWAQFVIKRSFQ